MYEERESVNQTSGQQPSATGPGDSIPNNASKSERDPRCRRARPPPSEEPGGLRTMAEEAKDQALTATNSLCSSEDEGQVDLAFTLLDPIKLSLCQEHMSDE